MSYSGLRCRRRGQPGEADAGGGGQGGAEEVTAVNDAAHGRILGVRGNGGDCTSCSERGERGGRGREGDDGGGRIDHLLLVGRRNLAYPPTTTIRSSPQRRGDSHVSSTADDSQPLVRPTNLRHLVLAALLVITAINYIQRNCINPAATTIQADLGLDLAEIGLILGAFFLSYTFLQVPSGATVQCRAPSGAGAVRRRLVAGAGRHFPGRRLLRPVRRPPGDGCAAGRHLSLRHVDRRCGIPPACAAWPRHCSTVSWSSAVPPAPS